MKAVSFHASMPQRSVVSQAAGRTENPLTSIRFGQAEAPANGSLSGKVSHAVFVARSWVQNTFFNPTAGNTPLNKAVFTVIDTETTGFSPKKCDFTEITAIKYKGGHEIARFSTLVKPSHPIPPKVVELTHITDDMVKNAPSPARVLKDLGTFVGRSPLVVGHNVRFDLNFLTHHMTVNGMADLAKRFTPEQSFCTKTLGQIAVPGLPSYKGTELAKHLGIKNDMPHRAEYDVKMTAEMLYKLFERMNDKAQTVATVSDLRRYQGEPIRSHDGKPPIWERQKPAS
jgi:DNA polymerase III epsilon subunit family exonuclease